MGNIRQPFRLIAYPLECPLKNIRLSILTRMLALITATANWNTPTLLIFEIELVPTEFQAGGGEVLTAVYGTSGFNEVYEGLNHQGDKVRIPATKILASGEVIDLTPSIDKNSLFFSEGPGYSTQP